MVRGVQGGGVEVGRGEGNARLGMCVGVGVRVVCLACVVSR